MCTECTCVHAHAPSPNPIVLHRHSLALRSRTPLPALRSPSAPTPTAAAASAREVRVRRHGSSARAEGRDGAQLLHVAYCGGAGSCQPISHHRVRTDVDFAEPSAFGDILRSNGLLRPAMPIHCCMQPRMSPTPSPCGQWPMGRPPWRCIPLTNCPCRLVLGKAGGAAPRAKKCGHGRSKNDMFCR